MGLKTVLLIPYKDFKDKIRLTQEYRQKGYYIEVWEDHVFCFREAGHRKKQRSKKG